MLWEMKNDFFGFLNERQKEINGQNSLMIDDGLMVWKMGIEIGSGVS
jgi:hypothetical protein